MPTTGDVRARRGAGRAGSGPSHTPAPVRPPAGRVRAAGPRDPFPPGVGAVGVDRRAGRDARGRADDPVVGPGPGRPRRRQSSTVRERRGALLAALVVLALWFAWLLAPTPGDGAAAPDPPLPTWDGDPVTGAAGAGSAAGDEPAAGGEPGEAGEVAGEEAADAARSRSVGEALTADGATGQDGAAVPAPSAEAAGPGPDAAVQVPQAGAGTFTVAPGTGEVAGDGDLVTYTVEVEDGVPVDPAEVAQVVEAVLGDPRSWSGDGRWALQRVAADGDARIVVTSPDTTDRLCAPLRTNGQVSCRNGENVVLNALRWTQGARTWGSDVTGYRQYLVNHEVGHLLGFGHVRCPGAGAPAPVMLQQTLTLDGCEPNAWPSP